MKWVSIVRFVFDFARAGRLWHGAGIILDQFPVRDPTMALQVERMEEKNMLPQRRKGRRDSVFCFPFVLSAGILEDQRKAKTFPFSAIFTPLR